jgi:hypothetical protein
MNLREKEKLVADIINDSDIIPTSLEYVRLGKAIEWYVVIKRKESLLERDLCYNDEEEMRMVCMFLEAIIKLAKEEDCPDFFKSEITVDADFVHNVLNNVCINSYFNEESEDDYEDVIVDVKAYSTDMLEAIRDDIKIELNRRGNK